MSLPKHYSLTQESSRRTMLMNSHIATTETTIFITLRYITVIVTSRLITLKSGQSIFIAALLWRHHCIAIQTTSFTRIFHNLNISNSSIINSNYNSNSGKSSSSNVRCLLLHQCAYRQSLRRGVDLPLAYAALEESKRPTITTSPLPPPIRTSIQQPPCSELHPPTSPLFSQEDFMTAQSENNTSSPGSVTPAMPAPKTLFGMPCSEASRRSYSKHNEDVADSFHRLQQMDSGTVQYRTIAFSTHLTVSRWEPADESTTAAHASTSIKAPSPATSSVATFAEDKTKIEHKGLTPASDQKQPQQPQSGNGTSQAGRLMSLANYIRHIITLTSEKSLLHSPSALMQQRLVTMQQQQQQARREQLRKLQGWRPVSTDVLSSNKETNLPSPLSAGSGPIKPSDSLSTRKHRYASEYHDHQVRRQLHHSHQLQQRENNPLRLNHLEAAGHQLPSPISPLVPMIGSLVQQPPRKQTKQNQTTPQFPPLLSIPFPNLTLTLALIYVDRLKAKYPEAKGEPGCSHRLFLVAYIIAAKYRCSVELAALIKESSNVDSAAEDRDETQDATSAACENIQSKPIEERLSEARSRAELIFSNHEWVRLLSFGSFFRPLNYVTVAATSTTAEDSTAGMATAKPIGRSPCDAPSATKKPEPKSLLIQAVPPAGDTKNAVKVGEMATPTPAPMQATILQVEDLDRMEAEFLTFLSFDLSTRGQDIDTCWNLLVGDLSV
ncbi:hypothetical protein BGZ72_004088 [Mortierella alpina]|nr:hypothetical protein BGZ72_004088 [Mortierella alpina]